MREIHQFFRSKTGSLCRALVAVFAIQCCALAPLFAAEPTPPTEAVALEVKSQNLDKAGVVRGGRADNYLSLLEIRRLLGRTHRIERITIDWGDRVLAPVAKGGYYAVEYFPEELKVVVTMSLALGTKFEPSQAKASLKDGLWVKDADLAFDPVSQSQILTLHLKKRVKLKVTTTEGKAPAQLSVDLIAL